MVTRIRAHLSYANVMATIAVFVALGGGAYAATKLPKNSVTTIQVKDRSLLANDFKRGQLPAGAKGDKGGSGAQGAQGPAGTNGANGTNGKDGANAATSVVYRRTIITVVSKATGTATAACQPGERMIGGGGGFIAQLFETVLPGADNVSYSGPTDAGGANIAAADSSAPGGWSV